MPHADSAHLRGAGCAILTAGPLFMTLYLAADLYRRIPDAITVDWGILIVLPLILLFALIFGPLVAATPIIIGTTSMRVLAYHCPLFAPRPFWLLAGAAIGFGVAYGCGLLGSARDVSFALIATSGISGRLAYTPE